LERNASPAARLVVTVLLSESRLTVRAHPVATELTTGPRLNTREVLEANGPSTAKGRLGAILIRTEVEVVLRFEKPNMGGKNRVRLVGRIRWCVMKV
jgi:hypothetical protein